MSGPFGSSQWMYASGGFYPYQIEQSLRFNDNDSAYLSKLWGSAGNKQTFTYSFWIKRANIGSRMDFISFQQDVPISFNSDTIRVFLFGGDRLITSAQFRDVSAWYHIVLTVDSTDATSGDRIKLYVNGERQTDFSTESYPSLNANANIYTVGLNQYIGRLYGGSNYFDGYVADMYYLDGIAADASSFGETKSGIWVPKAYAGSYGTNGFYLSFADSAAIGDDLSGNGNDWTANNLISTDVLLDSPTNNFAIMNSLWKSSNTVLEEGNLYLPSRSYYSNAVGTMGVSSGKWYFEARVGNNFGSYSEFGVIATDDNTFINQVTSALRSNVTWSQLDKIYNNGTLVTNPTSPNLYNTSTKIIGCAVDLDNNKVYFHGNGTWLNSSDPDTNTGGTTIAAAIQGKTFVPLVGTNNVSASPNTWVNFGQDGTFAGTEISQGNTDDNGVGDFYYAPPAGFLALNTANLPDPVIDPAQDDVPADYFNTVLYTGDATSSNAVTGVGFQPDKVWIKRRDAGASDHYIADAVRGATKQLISNSTAAEATNNGLTSFDSDGFTVGLVGDTNANAGSFVAWNWKANGAGVSNTDGTITSTVSANQKAGFSIVSYTGNATAGATVGHGLGAAPSMLIFKNRDVGRNWLVYMPSILGVGNSDYLMLDQTGAEGFAGAVNGLNSTSPSASVITLGNDANVNESTRGFIAYCFAEVEGYSKFGRYTGNGSTDGPFVWCGFRPAFVMVKRTDAANDWVILDNERDPYNLARKSLFPNSASSETANGFYDSDIVSNGIKLRSSNAVINASGGTYIFAAFAESPFKYANAR